MLCIEFLIVLHEIISGDIFKRLIDQIFKLNFSAHLNFLLLNK